MPTASGSNQGHGAGTCARIDRRFVHPGCDSSPCQHPQPPIAGIRSQRVYMGQRGFAGGDVSQVADNVRDRQFEVDEPNQAWVTDFTFIRIHEFW